ncbi:hypothetical protein ABZ890_08300 [Streptomyces sp. NPDC046984]|uniref:hypothetical protein n=1 Tax=Streptomyces sp. NPDC046984 TaxID=3155138 RepID=UPI0033ED8638
MARFGADDLRRLASAMDAMDAMSIATGVTITSYSDTQITIDGHVIRVVWHESTGSYLAEWPGEA